MPYCSGYIFSKGFNDLQTTHPEIQKSWLIESGSADENLEIIESNICASKRGIRLIKLPMKAQNWIMPII